MEYTLSELEKPYYLGLLMQWGLAVEVGVNDDRAPITILYRDGEPVLISKKEDSELVKKILERNLIKVKQHIPMSSLREIISYLNRDIFLPN